MQVTISVEVLSKPDFREYASCCVANLKHCEIGTWSNYISNTFHYLGVKFPGAMVEQINNSQSIKILIWWDILPLIAIKYDLQFI